MSSIRPTGLGAAGALRINGQEIAPSPARPVDGAKPAAGVATDRPVTGPADPYAAQEHMYEQAHQAAIRGELAAATLQGKKNAKTRDVRDLKKKKAEHKRISRLFDEHDPQQRQESAYDAAAEFEERVQEHDLSFARRSGQVEAGHQVYATDLPDGAGSVVSGEAAEFDIDTSDLEATRTQVRPTSHATSHPTAQGRDARLEGAEAPFVASAHDETQPKIDVSLSETGLRRVLGLKKP